MAGWVEYNGTYTYTTDEYIAVVSAVEIVDFTIFYGYTIYTNDKNLDVVWSSDRDSGINYYYFEEEAKDRALATIREFEGR